MATEYAKSDEVREIAERLIAYFHPRLQGANMVYLFKNQRDAKGMSVMPVVRGRSKWGFAKIVSSLDAFLISGEEQTSDADEQYCLVVITKMAWDTITEVQRVALIDHELCHFVFDDESGRVRLRDHDIEEFQEIMERYGTWRDDLEAFVDAATMERPMMPPPIVDPPQQGDNPS